MSEIEKHERYKQMALYSYNINLHELPQGAKLIGIFNDDNGFYAPVIKDGNEIIIAIRGTNGRSWYDKELHKDAKNDLTMWTGEWPVQADSALKALDKMCIMKKEDPAYAECTIVVVGHSLGGALAQIVATIKKVKAVTFNAYGVRNVLKGVPELDAVDVINYCNPDDKFTTGLNSRHIGKCYEIESDFVEGKNPHLLENMNSLKNRIPVASDDLVGEAMRRAGVRLREKLDFEHWRRTGRRLPIQMPAMGYHDDNCAGTYMVSGYTREDGTKVSGYPRTCGAKHSS